MRLDRESQAVLEVSQKPIEGITLLRLKIPLRTPYHLSFGTLTHFHTILCGLKMDGDLCWGETTPLPGYGSETPEDAWRWSIEAAKRVCGVPAREAFSWAWQSSRQHPFSTAALLGALEWPSLAPYLNQGASLPLVAPLAGYDPGRLAEDAAYLHQQGFTAFKYKVGRRPASEARLLAELLPRLPPGTSLRSDANQALNLEDALLLTRALDHPAAEYLEQPFPAGDWDSLHDLLQRHPGARLCLDESVWREEDLDHALALGPGVAVKLKLMKQSCARRLLAMAQRLQKQGRRLVFGNGVQSELGSLAEAALYHALGLREASEGNGFARQARSLLEPPGPALRRGHLEMPPLTSNPQPAVEAEEMLEERWQV